MSTVFVWSGFRTDPVRFRSRRGGHPVRLARGRPLFRVGTLASLALAIGLAIPSQVPAAERQGQAEPKTPIVHDAEITAAILVEVEPRCSEIRFRASEAKFRWSIDASAIAKSEAVAKLMATTEFRIDVSDSPAGLESGRIESVNISSSNSQLDESLKVGDQHAPSHAAVVRDLSPGVYYHARLLVRTTEGWVASTTIGFISPVCPADGLEKNQGGAR